LSLIFAGEREREDYEHNELAWAAWHIAAMPKMRDFPNIEKLMINRKKQKRELTPDEMWALMVPMTYTKN
jgi:hypothetical protein